VFQTDKYKKKKNLIRQFCAYSSADSNDNNAERGRQFITAHWSNGGLLYQKMFSAFNYLCSQQTVT
jgi:hypothetical protein